MKKLIVLMLLGLASFTARAETDTLSHITELWFENGNFVELDVSKCDSLQTLTCYDNELTSLDVSENAALQTLSCWGNQLTNLDVSKNVALQTLSCWGNQLTNLDVSENAALQTLSCWGNQLTNLDVSKNVALQTLSCWGNQLTNLDVSKNAALQTLDCSNNQLTALDVSDLANLKSVKAIDNPLVVFNARNSGESLTFELPKNTIQYMDLSGSAILQISLSGYPVLEDLNLSNCRSLRAVNLENTGIKDLNVQGCNALVSISCHNNNLQTLDVTTNVALQTLYCVGNQLTSLDMRNCGDLQTLDCADNALTNLNIIGCAALKKLNCSNNTLTNLSLKGCVSLSNLDCSNNNLIQLNPNGTCLDSLDCSGNRLTSLTLKGCATLRELNCVNNQLQTLDVSQSTALQNLYCSDNRLTTLDLSKNLQLRKLDCSGNRLKSLQANYYYQQGGSYYYMQTFHAQMNHLPLSTLYPFRQSSDCLFSPQSDTMRLAGYDAIDLSQEMRIGSTNTEWVLTDSDGLEVEEGFEENAGVFRFLQKGDYNLVLLNSEVRDGKGIARFYWTLNVISDAYDIAVQTNNTNWGSVGGAGKYAQDSAVIITATPKPGYRFVHWKRGDEIFGTKAVDTFRASGNLMLTAYFELIPSYAINVQANNDDFGMVAGSGNYKEGTIVEVVATAKEGCRFVNWKNGEEEVSNQDIYTFQATQNLSLTAYFEKITYTIAVETDNAEWGTVEISGNGTYEWGSDVTIIATPKEGYRFVYWKNGDVVFSTQIGYTFKADENLTLTAHFERKPVIMVQANNPDWGNVSSNITTETDEYTYEKIDWVTITATPKEGYRFVFWENDSTSEEFSRQSRYTFKATEDMTLTAYFEEIPVYTVSIEPNDYDGGTVTVREGAGEYREGSYVPIDATATPAQGYRFLYWKEAGYDDVISTNARLNGSIRSLEEDITIVAHFEKIPVVVVQANNSEWGSVSSSIGEGYEYKEPYEWYYWASIRAKEEPGYRFVHWKKGDVVFSTESYDVFDITGNFNVNETISLTAYFEPLPAYTIQVMSNNPEMGTVSISGNGSYQTGTSVTIVASAKEGYRFVNWKKGNEVFSDQAVYTFKASEELTLVAYFEKIVGNENHQERKVFVYAENKVIHLSEPMGKVQVFNALGQCVYSGNDTEIPLRASGLYMVRIRTKTYKVVVK